MSVLYVTFDADYFGQKIFLEKPYNLVEFRI